MRISINCVTPYLALQLLICRCTPSKLTIKRRRKGSIKSGRSYPPRPFFMLRIHIQHSHLSSQIYLTPFEIQGFEDKQALLLRPFAWCCEPDSVRVGGVCKSKGLLNVNTLNRWAIVPFYTRLHFSIFYAIRYEFWLGRFFMRMGIRVGNIGGVTGKNDRKS